MRIPLLLFNCLLFFGASAQYSMPHEDSPHDRTASHAQ